jgi:molecular chaperone DnaJ
MSHKDYYLVLGVAHDASARGIRAAFRELARKYHPDRAGPRAARHFQTLAEAYHMLSDGERRAAYDRGLAHRGASRRRGPLTPPWQTASDALAVHRGDALHGARWRRPTSNGVFHHFADAYLFGQELPRPRPVRVDVQLTAKDATSGGILTFDVPLFYPCFSCRSSGWHGSLSCRRCRGVGMVEELGVARLTIPPLVGDGSLFEVPLGGLGVNDLFLEVRVHVTG